MAQQPVGPESLYGPKDPRIEIAKNTVQLLNRLRQAYPAFFENYNVDTVEIKFSEPLSETKSAITTIYDGTKLIGIHINPQLTAYMYEELDEVSYTDLVRTNIGIALCLDAVFQRLLKEDFYDPRVTEALESMLLDRVTPLARLKEVFGQNYEDNSYIENTWNQMLTHDSSSINTDLLARLNAQRLAFGLVLAAEESRYGAEEYISLRDASRHYIVDKVRSYARRLAFVGLALTGDIGTSVRGATQQLISPDVLPYAIPFRTDEIQELIGKMKKAQNSLNFHYDKTHILDLSDAIPDVGPL